MVKLEEYVKLMRMVRICIVLRWMDDKCQITLLCIGMALNYGGRLLNYVNFTIWIRFDSNQFNLTGWHFMETRVSIQVPLNTILYNLHITIECSIESKCVYLVWFAGSHSHTNIIYKLTNSRKHLGPKQ